MCEHHIQLLCACSRGQPVDRGSEGHLVSGVTSMRSATANLSKLAAASVEYLYCCSWRRWCMLTPLLGAAATAASRQRSGGVMPRKKVTTATSALSCCCDGSAGGGGAGAAP